MTHGLRNSIPQPADALRSGIEAECFYDAIRKMWPHCFTSHGILGNSIAYRYCPDDERNSSMRRVYIFDRLRILVEQRSL